VNQRNKHFQINCKDTSPFGGDPTITEHIDDTNYDYWADHSSYSLGGVDYVTGFLLLSSFQKENAE